jgi:hypothetical protein
MCCTDGSSPNAGMCFAVDPNDACSCGNACYAVGPALHGPAQYQAKCNAPNHCWRTPDYSDIECNSANGKTVDVGYCPTPGT